MIACAMRIVVVNRHATPGGGADKHAVDLARALRDRDHEVRFLSTLTTGNVERQGAFVPLTGTDFWRGQPPPRQRLNVAANALWNRRAAAAMVALIERFRPDLVHAHDLYPQLSAAPVAVAAERHVPVVQTLHNYELLSATAVDHRGGALDRSDAPASVRLLRTALHVTRRRLHVPHVTVWIAVSRFVAHAYSRSGIDARVLPNFTTPGGRESRASFEDRSGVLFVGRLTNAKGVPDVVELARCLPQIPVTVVGWGPLEECVRTASERVENLAHVGFLRRDALAEQLARSRLLVVPSRWQEPAGLVALEAMAEGTPVVAYASGGLSEYVGDSGGGQVVRPDSAELVEATRDLYRDRERWMGLSAAGRRWVESEHSLARYLERLESLYARVRAGTARDAAR
jgi:glycosyltransferase involved in cell wall biosynthesis